MDRLSPPSGQESRLRNVRAIGCVVTAVIGLVLLASPASAQSTDPYGRDHGRDRRPTAQEDRRQHEGRRPEDRRDVYRPEDYRRNDPRRDDSRRDDYRRDAPPRTDPRGQDYRAQDYYGGGGDRRDQGRAAYVDPANGRPPVRPTPPPADSLGAGWRQQQYEARDGVRQGRIAPLGKVIDEIRRRSPGRQLDAGLESNASGRTVYRVRWASADGRRLDYIVDAETGHILGVDGR